MKNIDVISDYIDNLFVLSLVGTYCFLLYMTKKRQEKELEVAEMLWFLLGVMRMEYIRNEYFRGAPQIEWIGKMICKGKKAKVDLNMSRAVIC